MSATRNRRRIPTASPQSRSWAAPWSPALRGIGAATARALAEDGWSVAVNYSRDREGAESVAGSIEDAGGAALAVGADVADAGATEQMLSEVTERLGPVLVLVNNAGITADNLSMRLSDEDWNRVLDVNLTGAFRLTRDAIGSMMRQRFGRVINVSSVVGLRANPGQANYAASKAGLIAFTRTVAAEVARARSDGERGRARVDRDRSDREFDRHGRTRVRRPARRDPRAPDRTAGGGRRLHPLPRVRRRLVCDRSRAARRRRHAPSDQQRERKESPMTTQPRIR